MSADTSILPAELTVIPVPLIGVAGLDISNNPVHKTIWEAFTYNRKNDRSQIQFKLLPPNYEFPVSKPKRTSYEWYHPKGILKKNWMLKHLHVLPAVVVLFQDIEWNDPLWSEKQLHCAAQMQTIKNSLQGQNTKLAIALLQTGSPLPIGENLLATERNAHLASACDINPKLIFVLPHNDHLMGYTYRLESSFLELSQSYYTQMAKQIRLHRDQLSDAHMALKIRHQFKLGMIAEIRMDTQAALKHYVAAYAHLDEIRIIDTNCLEIKTIAGFLNYKMCKLMFRTVPREAIDHFKAHVERFRSRTGFKELLFEHYAWLSLQYSAFAELFCDAIKYGLPALQTQHPGIYYHKAAEFMGKRKEAFAECFAAVASKSAATNTSDAPSSASVLYSEFFGVRSTKIGDPITDQQVVHFVQAQEKSFNHSTAIIMLLGQAMAQFKLHKCLRFRKKLAVDMAEEYLKSGDHAKALTLYSLMLSDYRTDKWGTIFTEVLRKTILSAYLSASAVDFVTCCIEALSPKIAIPLDERKSIYDNLWKVLLNQMPTHPMESGGIRASSAAIDVSSLQRLWKTALSKFRSPVHVELDKLTDLFECMVSFDQPQIKHDERVKVQLFIRSKSEIPIKIKEFTIVLADSSLNFKLRPESCRVIVAKKQSDIDDSTVADVSLKEGLILQPNICYGLNFSAGQYKFTENEELCILRLEMVMGSDVHHAMLMQNSGFNQVKQFKAYNTQEDCMADVPINTNCYIVPTFHLQTQNTLTNQPMLTNEYFRAESIINNTFDVALQNVGISITVPANFKNKVFITTDLTKLNQRLLSNIQIDIGDLPMHDSTVVQYYVCSLMEGNIELTHKIWYQIDNNTTVITSTTSATNDTSSSVIVESPLHKPSAAVSIATSAAATRIKNNNMNIEYLADGSGVRKFREDVVIIPCIEEFNVRARFFQLNKQALRHAYRAEDFLLRIDVEMKANCSIDILDMFLITDHNIIEKPYSNQRRAKLGHAYGRGQKLRDVRILHANRTTIDWTTTCSSTDSADSLLGAEKTAAQLFASSQQGHRNSITRQSIERSSDHSVRREDKFKTNLLAKIPINSTIIGSNQMNRSFTTATAEQDKGNRGGKDSMNSSFHESISAGDLQVAATAAAAGTGNGLSVRVLTKNIHNRAIDAFSLTDHCRGFLRDASVPSDLQCPWPVFGVYCVRWRRNGGGATEENESKFIIQGIEVIDPPLNIYCYLEDKMYVKVPMTLRITIKNPSRFVVRLKTCLKNSENFMFSGNTQLNISIYSFASYDLSFNLYPLKAGWQDLPEFEIKYNTQYSDDVPANLHDLHDAIAVAEETTIELNAQLQSLVNRWMPKRVFVLPMLRHVQQ